MKTLLLALLMLNVVIAHSEIGLPAVIGDNMVLQQRSTVPLWGTAGAKTLVKAMPSWDHHTYSTIAAADGSWRIMIKTPVAGGPYTITLDDGKKLVIRNVLIGEVWICSGQSNMEMPVKGFANQPVMHSNELLLDAENPDIHLFRLERASSRKPEKNCKATGWEIANAVSAKEFSAVGYQFAKALQQKLKIPIGIIMSTWGGTVIEAWMDRPSLAPFEGVNIRSADDTARINKNEPTVLFNAMIHPIAGYAIRGVIWYQGEQNRTNSRIYDKLMTAMVTEWRKLWQCGDWPFYYVQIAPYAYHDTLGPAAPLREAQEKASLVIPHCGMVVSMDAGDEHSIHPADKTIISQRLLYWALADTYGWKGLAYASPAYRAMKVTKNSISLSFDHADNGLKAFGKPLAAFEIAGADKHFFPARARITASGITVQSDSVADPVAVRYAYKDWMPGDLYNTEGLPAAPFRTDNW